MNRQPPQTTFSAGSSLGSTLDLVSLSGLQLQAIIGVYPHERLQPQRLVVDLAMALDTRRSATSLALTETIDYAKIARDLRILVQGAQFHLLETAAEAIAAFILTASVADYTCPERVRVVVSKPSAMDNLATPSVSIERAKSDIAPKTIDQTGTDTSALIIFESADVCIAVSGPNHRGNVLQRSENPSIREMIFPLSDSDQNATRRLHIVRKEQQCFLTAPTHLEESPRELHLEYSELKF